MESVVEGCFEESNEVNPTAEEMASPIFEAIFQEIKAWDISTESDHIGDHPLYTSGNGSHAARIYRAVKAAN